MGKKYKIGYTQGVYDMFHVGHLNLLNRAKEYCDFLIVGVNSDTLVENYKRKIPVVNQKDRLYIILNIKAVDKAIIVETLDKKKVLQQLHFDAVFIGDDWKGNPRWEATERELKQYGVDVIFLPYTHGVSSTALRPERKFKIDDNFIG